MRVDPAQRRHPARFIDIDMRFVADDGFFAARTMHEQCQQITHRPRRHEERRTLAKHLGSFLLKFIHRRVIAIHIIPHLRLRHRLAHFRSRFGNSI